MMPQTATTNDILENVKQMSKSGADITKYTFVTQLETHCGNTDDNGQTGISGMETNMYHTLIDSGSEHCKGTVMSQHKKCEDAHNVQPIVDKQKQNVHNMYCAQPDSDQAVTVLTEKVLDGQTCVCNRCGRISTRYHPDDLLDQSYVVNLFAVGNESNLDKGYSCKECGDEFETGQALTTHVRTDHSIIFTCTKCSDNEHAKSSLDTNESVLIANKPVNNLGKNDIEEVYLDDVTTKTDSVTVDKFRCSICRLKFKNSFSLSRHRRSKHPEEWFDCETCNKAYPTKGTLEEHKKSHVKKFQCTVDGCGKLCKTLRHLELHKQSHSEKGPFTCEICQKMFMSQGKLHAHQQYHNNERSFKCDVCNKAYKTMDVLTKHKRIHNPTYYLYCEQCGKGFNQTGALKRHLDTHNNTKRYKCEMCHSCFSQSLSLQIHKLNANHFKDSQELADKSVTCKFCDKRFLKEAKYLYERHLLIHSGDKPYTCDVCQKQFNNKSNLNAHHKIHTNNKPFKCDECGKSYIHKNHLKRHIENHQKVQVKKDRLVKVNVTTSTECVTHDIARSSSEQESPTSLVRNRDQKDALIPTAKRSQVPAPLSSAVSQCAVPSLPVLNPMSSIIGLSSSSSSSVSIPLSIVYDTSSILQLASVSAGVVDVQTIFPQASLNYQQKESFAEKSTNADLQQQSMGEQNAPAEDQATLDDEAQCALDEGIESEEQNSTWKQMNKMFTCKSPKDIDNANDNWI